MGRVDWMSQDIHVNRKVLQTCLCTPRLARPVICSLANEIPKPPVSGETLRDSSLDLADPLLQMHWDSSPYWEPTLLNPVNGLIMSL